MLFGIKNKFIISFLFTVACATIATTYNSISLFKADKSAYLYEAIFKNAQSDRDIVETKLKKVINILLTEDFYDELIDNDLIINAVEVNKSDINTSLQVKGTDDFSMYSPKRVKNNENIVVENFKSNLILSVSNKNVLRLVDLNKSLLFDKSELSSFDSTLVDSNMRSTKEISSDLIKKVGLSKRSGTRLVSSHDDSFLVGYVYSNLLNIYFLSLINESKTNSIFSYIISKNVASALILLGIFAILAVIVSKKFTTPILDIINVTNEISSGNLTKRVNVNTGDELNVLGESINSMSNSIETLLDEKQDMILKLEQANEQLDEYNKNLEGIVKERTRELSDANEFITTMVDSLDQGLFVFDEEGRTIGDSTRACEDLFGVDPKNKSVAEVLELDNSKSEDFDKWRDILFAGTLPFDSAKGLGPKERVFSKYGSKDFKHIDLNYFPIIKDDKLNSVVTVATDKTREIEAQEAFKEKDSYVSMIMKIIKNKEAFQNLVEEAYSMLHNLSKSIESYSDDLSKQSMIVFHTLNGGFGGFSVYKLQKLARNIESKLKEFHGNQNELVVLSSECHDLFIKELNKVVGELQESILGTKKTVELSLDEIDMIQREMDQVGVESIFNKYFVLQDASSIFSGYADLVSNLSKKTNKPMKELELITNGIRIKKDPYKEFSASLVHLFRNCIDHGIENKKVREAANKELEGLISVNVSKSADNLTINIQDDGAGLNTEKIKNKIKELEGIEALNKMSDKDIHMAIFQENFSTAETLTDLSGRGIGMSAIAQAVEKLGGSIDIDTKQGEGSKFTFTLPYIV